MKASLKKLQVFYRTRGNEQVCFFFSAGMAHVLVHRHCMVGSISPQSYFVQDCVTGTALPGCGCPSTVEMLYILKKKEKSSFFPFQHSTDSLTN